MNKLNRDIYPLRRPMPLPSRSEAASTQEDFVPYDMIHKPGSSREPEASHYYDLYAAHWFPKNGLVIDWAGQRAEQPVDCSDLAKVDPLVNPLATRAERRKYKVAGITRNAGGFLLGVAALDEIPNFTAHNGILVLLFGGAVVLGGSSERRDVRKQLAKRAASKETKLAETWRAEQEFRKNLLERAKRGNERSLLIEDQWLTVREDALNAHVPPTLDVVAGEPIATNAVWEKLETYDGQFRRKKQRPLFNPGGAVLHILNHAGEKAEEVISASMDPLIAIDEAQRDLLHKSIRNVESAHELRDALPKDEYVGYITSAEIAIADVALNVLKIGANMLALQRAALRNSAGTSVPLALPRALPDTSS